VDRDRKIYKKCINRSANNVREDAADYSALARQIPVRRRVGPRDESVIIYETKIIEFMESTGPA
jgi:hypothetical protein